MKIKKPKGGRRSLAAGEVPAEGNDEQNAEANTSVDGAQVQADVTEGKKSKLRRSLGGKVEKSRRSSRINKWSILDMFGFGSKKNKPNGKSQQKELSNENAPDTSKPSTNSETSSSDELNDSAVTASEAGHTPKKRGQIKPIDTQNKMDLVILQENTTIRKKKGRLSLDIVGTPGLFRKSDRKPLDNLANAAECSTSQKISAKTRAQKGPEITVNMIHTTKQRLRSTSDSVSTPNKITYDTKGTKMLMSAEKPRTKVTRDVRYVQKPSSIPVKSASKPKPDTTSGKPPVAKRKPVTPVRPKVHDAGSISRGERARAGVYNIRHAGNTPPSVSRRESVKSRRESNVQRRESTRRDNPSVSERTPGNRIILSQEENETKTFEPEITLKYFDEDSVEEAKDGLGSNDVIPLSAADLAALDVATSAPGNTSTICVQKRESLVEAMRKSPLLSPECHQTPSAGSADENTTEATPISAKKQERKSLVSSVSSTLSRSLQSSKSGLLGLRTRRAKTPQDGEATPRSHLRAVKRAHSIAVTSNIASLRGPCSPMLTPMSSVAKELQEMKSKKRRKEPTLEEIIKEHKKHKKDETTSKKPPPKPPRKNLKTKRSISRNRLRRRSIVAEDKTDQVKTSSESDVKVKRKPSIKDILKRKPPPKPVRRSLGSKQDITTGSEQEVSSASDENAGHIKTTSIGEGMRKLRRKLSRSGDMKQMRESPRSQAQVMSANAGHTPKPPRGRKDERLV